MAALSCASSGFGLTGLSACLSLFDVFVVNSSAADGKGDLPLPKKRYLETSPQVHQRTVRNLCSTTTVCGPNENLCANRFKWISDLNAEPSLVRRLPAFLQTSPAFLLSESQGSGNFFVERHRETPRVLWLLARLSATVVECSSDTHPLPMTETFSTSAQVTFLSFLLAFVFGVVANKTHFCTMGAIADVVQMGAWGRMRMWMLAIAVAIVGANALSLLGLVDLSQSIYARPRLLWLSHIVGGTLFGFGMVLASGCGNRSLVRIGGGSLKSLVVLAFLAISAYMTLKGLFGLARVNWIEPVAIDLSTAGGQDLPSLLNGAIGVSKASLQIAFASLLAITLAVFVFKDQDFRRDHELMLGGIAIGLLVTAGWYVSGHLGYAENPETLEMTYFATNSRAAESFSFVAPVAYGLELLMLWSDSSLRVTFGIAAVAGVVLGSFAYAVISGKFRWEGFSESADMRRHIVGGILMGFGGVTALGCTVGQGISGVSTLAIGSMLTLAAIITGAVLALKYLTWRLDR